MAWLEEAYINVKVGGEQADILILIYSALLFTCKSGKYKDHTLKILNPQTFLYKIIYITKCLSRR